MTEEMTTAVATKTNSAKFTGMILREFEATVGDGYQMTDVQRKLAQHLFLYIDGQLKALETKRKDQSKPAIEWGNVDLNKLALDACHRIDLGLDALIGNHIHAIPYLNGRTGKYALDLRIGYVGKDYYRRKFAIEPPKTVIYHLVYSTDKFKPIMRTGNAEGDRYEFEITQPFDRGEVQGGFGYLIYDDPAKNRLVLVPKKRIDRAERVGNKDFWTNNYEEMAFKTVVTATMNTLQPDPVKVNTSFVAVEAADNEDEVLAEIAEKGNQEYIDIESGEIIGPVDMEENGKEEPESTAGAPQTATASPQAATAGGNNAGKKRAPF